MNTRARRKSDGRSPQSRGRVGQKEPALEAPSDPAADVARYVAEMTAQMASMARAAKLDLLAYFLNMANAEAEAHARMDDEK